MKRKFTFIVLALTIWSLSSCAQNITAVKITDEQQRSQVKAWKAGEQSDNGQRTLKLSLNLEGRSRKTVFYNLSIDARGAVKSGPALTTPRIGISRNDFIKGKVEIMINVQLKQVDCLPNDETFKVEFDKSIAGLLKSNVNGITISHIDPVNPAKITLADEETVVKPYLKSDKNDNGQRTVILNLTAAGLSRFVNFKILSYQVPPYAKSTSNPKLVSDFEIDAAKLFDKNGCPKKIKLPVVVQLAPVDELKEEEKIPILLVKDGIIDNESTHWLVIKPDVKKPVTVEKAPDNDKYSFTHACFNKRVFKIKIDRDTVGGAIKVTEGKKAETYYFKNYFHSADFAKWLINSFDLKAIGGECNECATCANYLAERVYEELGLTKTLSSNVAGNPVKTAGTENAAAGTNSPGDDKTKTNLKDTASTGKKGSADSVKTENVKPDTQTYHITYGDSVFTLTVTKENDLTVLQLCKGTKPLPDGCPKQWITDVNRESFGSKLAAMLKKSTGLQALDTAKLNPVDVYDKYAKDLEAKKVKEKTEFEKAFDQFKSDFSKEELTYTKVGTVTLADSTGRVKIYKKGKNKNEQILYKESKIDSVRFSIEMGKLSTKLVRVYAGGEEFENTKAPIPVLRIKKRKYDNLWNFEEDKYIRIGDVLRYAPVSWHIPDDVDNLLLTPEKRAQSLSAASNLNSLINVSLYTDLAGLLGRRANGLINTDVASRFITNTGNFSNKDITPFSFIEGSISLSKFDSKFKSMDSSSIKAGPSNQDTVDRMQLIQTAWLKGGLKANLASYRFSRSQYVQVNIGARINVVNADSFYRKEKDKDIIMFDYYLEAAYNISRLKNFGMEISTKWIFQRLADKEKFYNKEWEYIFNPQISFSYYPVSNQNSRIYLRFNYFANRKKEANNFYQLQFGIKTGLKLPSSK